MKLCRLAVLFVAVLACAILGAPAPIPAAPIYSATSSKPYRALHTYYISPTGNDANSGLTPATAWATPHHKVVCGDVIIVAAGNYTSQFGLSNWGTVSNCPSTLGGIDGVGGIYFAALLCAGPDVMSCTVNTGAPFWVANSNWAIEGFWATSTLGRGGSCFLGDGVFTSSSTTFHHIAFINDIASTCDIAGFATSGGPGPQGSFDQTAVVGVAAYNTANSQTSGGICGSGISIIPGNGPDISSGTHVFVAAAFGWNNRNSTINGCNVTHLSYAPHSDGEFIIFDTWGAAYSVSGYRYQGVVEQSVIWANGNGAFAAFPQSKTGDKAQIYVLNNTFYGNNQDALAACSGELYLNQVSPIGKGKYIFSNNIMLATMGSCGNAGHFNVYGATVTSQTGGVELTDPPITISGNWIWNNNPPTTNSPGGENTHVFNTNEGNGAPWVFGINTYGNPGLTNPSRLWSTAPKCAGYTNVAACMLTGYEVYNLIKPTIAPTTVGYQPPAGCRPDPYYPMWLKGVVYLHWDGANLTEVDGLITKPCGL